MKISSDSFKDGQRIPESCAFGKPNPETHVELSDNKNPHLAWSDLPAGTKSLVLICHDADVPSKPDNVNQEGVTVPADLPRVDFYHWVLVDLAPDSSPIAEGEFSNSITPKGKPGPDGPRGTRQGINNYTQWFADDESMSGNYFGYDGPCPPWNDERRPLPAVERRDHPPLPLHPLRHRSRQVPGAGGVHRPRRFERHRGSRPRQSVADRNVRGVPDGEVRLQTTEPGTGLGFALVT
jgi:phosphatidylethanolamine-binding protein (PEBP) family uncharacterized protein